MPPVIVAAGVAGGMSLIGGALQNRASGKATDAQLAANREALDYQRGRDALSQRQSATMWDDYNTRRAMLMRRYGLEVPEFQNPYATAAAPMAEPRAALTLAELAQRKPYIRGGEV